MRFSCTTTRLREAFSGYKVYKQCHIDVNVKSRNRHNRQGWKLFLHHDLASTLFWAVLPLGTHSRIVTVSLFCQRLKTKHPLGLTRLRFIMTRLKTQQEATSHFFGLERKKHRDRLDGRRSYYKFVPSSLLGTILLRNGR